MAGGRPQEYDRIQIGHDFIKFAKENPDCLTVPGFTSTIGLHSGMLRNWARECNSFRALFLEGKEIIGLNRLRATRQDSPFRLDQGIYRQVAGNYDVDINEYMHEEKEFDAALERKDSVAYTQEDKAKLDKINNQLSSMSEALKSSRTSKSKET